MLLALLQVVLEMLWEMQLELQQVQLENLGIHLAGLEVAKVTTKEGKVEQDLKRDHQKQKLIWQDLEQ